MYQSATGGTCLETYFEEMREKSVLTRDEEIALSKRILNGDLAARHTMVESNLRLVVKIARRYRTSRVSLEELVQEGNVGLVQAAARFDYRKNAKFSTYAAPWIKQAINRFLNDKTRAISIPHRKEEKLKRIRLAKETLQHDFGRTPSNREIAHYLGIEEPEIDRYTAFEYETCSLEADEPASSVLRVWQDSTYLPERDFSRQCLRDETARMLDTLRTVEKTVIRHRFEINGARKMTLRELGDHLGISAESVRLVEKRAIGKLRVTAEPLIDYLCEN
jgi:RNA polymerase primary sigma factor